MKKWIHKKAKAVNLISVEDLTMLFHVAYLVRFWVYAYIGIEMTTCLGIGIAPLYAYHFCFLIRPPYRNNQYQNEESPKSF